MAQLAIADWLIGLAYFFTAVKRIVRTVMVSDGAGKHQVQCVAEIWPLTFSVDASMAFSLGLAVDRLILLTWPGLYNKTSNIT